MGGVSTPATFTRPRAVQLSFVFARECNKNDDQLKAATITYFENLAGEHYRRKLQKMEKRCTKCLDSGTDYVEK